MLLKVEGIKGQRKRFDC